MTVRLTNPPSTPAAPQWLRDLVAARTHYEELLGWPVTVDIEPRRLAVAVGQVLDAVTMPTALGHSVLAELKITMLTGPVVADPSDTWWTFLTAPATASRPDIPADLHARKVYLTPRGAQVIIPSRIDGDSSRWIAPPRPRHPLPPWSVVIGATRRVADHLAATDRR
ncbi:hypothetical protein LWC34_54490 [Kibdelosporangium philippinense]|uniref:DNA primase/polymerase bifunctional N-terminal domain-containing protein n=1 Tax=Kibdelosporangium philippinense TaxID=211113 RepID=A0ABS8ZVP2_9PSEU|nr:hypothetical protein [Kibdelosporangium philippinense]MCE7011768.1 hypothetical protein [Kibdelosporangium philippinense]